MLEYRKEQKYFLTNDKYNQLLSIIKNNIKPDKYYKQTIYNIYFDNDNNDLIINSINAPQYKEKVRLRCYEIPNNNTNVYFEIKRKYNGLVNKRRIMLPYYQVNNYLNYKIMPNSNQVMKEIDYCFKYYKLKAKIIISYDREAYTNINDSSFRLTLDNNLKFDNNLNLNKTTKESQFEGYIMEIKTLKSIPNWLNKALIQLQIYPISFSKYGEIYKKIKECDANV